MFYYKLVYTVASVDTQRIDSNLESGRYISRVGGLVGFSLYRMVNCNDASAIDILTVMLTLLYLYNIPRSLDAVARQAHVMGNGRRQRPFRSSG